MTISVSLRIRTTHSSSQFYPDFIILISRAIFLSLQACGITVDTVDDSLYTWDVRLHDFPHGTQLADDLRVLQNNFGYDYVQLQLVGSDIFYNSIF